MILGIFLLLKKNTSRKANLIILFLLNLNLVPICSQHFSTNIFVTSTHRTILNCVITQKRFAAHVKSFASKLFKTLSIKNSHSSICKSFLKEFFHYFLTLFKVCFVFVELLHRLRAAEVYKTIYDNHVQFYDLDHIAYKKSLSEFCIRKYFLAELFKNIPQKY